MIPSSRNPILWGWIGTPPCGTLVLGEWVRDNKRMISIRWTGNPFCSCVFFAVYTGAVYSACHFCLFIPVFLSQMSVPCAVVSGWTRQLLSLIKTPIFSLHISQMLSWYLTLHCCEQKCRFSFLCSKINQFIALFCFPFSFGLYIFHCKAQQSLWLLLCYLPWMLISSFHRPGADIQNEMVNCENIFYYSCEFFLQSVSLVCSNLKH